MNTKNINPVAYFLITFFGGYLGIHKFIDGKIGMGVLYIFTCGLFGIGWIIDTVKALVAIFNPPATQNNEYVPFSTNIQQHSFFPKDYHYTYNLYDGKTLTQDGNNVSLEKGEKELFYGDIIDISPSGEYWLIEGAKGDDEAVALFKKEMPLQIKNFYCDFGNVFDTGVAICCCDEEVLILTPDGSSKKTVTFGVSKECSLLNADYCIFYEFDGYEFFIKVFNLIAGTSWQKKKSFDDDIDAEANVIRNGNFINVSIGDNTNITYDLNGNIQK